MPFQSTKRWTLPLAAAKGAVDLSRAASVTAESCALVVLVPPELARFAHCRTGAPGWLTARRSLGP